MFGIKITDQKANFIGKGKSNKNILFIVFSSKKTNEKF